MSYEKLTNFVLYTRWMQEHDLDVMVVTSAPKGFGKSSFIIQFSRKYIEIFGLICKSCSHKWIFTGNSLDQTKEGFKLRPELIEPCPKCKSESVGKQKELDFMKHLAYDNDEVREKIFDIEAFSPILADEGVHFLMGEDWMNYDNKKMKKLFAQMRTKHLIVLTNIPKFVWIDKKYRNDMATFWVRILKRGLALLMQPDLAETEDAWHLKDFQKMLGSYFYFTPDSELIRRSEKIKSKHPCCFDYFHIPPVPESLYNSYLITRNSKVFVRASKEEKIDQKDLAKICAWNLMNKWPEIMGAIKISRADRPTYKMMENFVFCDPITSEKIPGHTTIRNWINDLNRVVKKPYSR